MKAVIPAAAEAGTDKLSEADMAKRVNQVVQSQSVFAQPVENAGEDSVNVPAASSEGDRDMSSSTTGGGVSGNGPGTGGGSGGGNGGGTGSGNAQLVKVRVAEAEREKLCEHLSTTRDLGRL